MTKEELKDFLVPCGWEVDRWGHLQKVVMRRRPGQEARYPRKFRIALHALSCRIETRVPAEDARFPGLKYKWIRVGGAYYKDICELDDGRIRIGSYFFGQSKGDLQ